jgi:hypothetical protein
MNNPPGNVSQQWAAFCDQIKAAGTDILESANGLDGVSQAEGLRYLTRLLRGSFEKYVEFADPLDPVIYKMSDERNKYGGDNPDNIYAASPLSDREEYEITGNRGSVGHFNFSIFKFDSDGVWDLSSIKEGRELECDGDGNFKLALGGERKPGNWMPIAPGSNLILVRQTFADRATEREAKVAIRRTSSSGSVSQLTLEQAQSRLQAAQLFFCNTGRMMHEWSKALVPTVNRLSPTDPALIKAGGGDPNVFYFWCSWKIAAGEALLIQIPEYPADKNWNLVLYNFWLESLDYTQFRIHLNNRTAHKNADGSITIVISNTDPGVPNWLNASGHSQGNMMLRCWSAGLRPVDPFTQVVQLDSTDLKSKFSRWQA